MSEPEESPAKRRLAIDLPELEAFEDAAPGTRYYLNLEIGELARVTYELAGIEREG